MKAHVPSDIHALKNHKGFIEWPDVITGRMFCAWWQEYERKEDESMYNQAWFTRWRAALALLKSYGTIEIEGIHSGDLTPKADNVPLAVVVWVGKVIDEELGELLALKKTHVKPSYTLKTGSALSQEG